MNSKASVWLLILVLAISLQGCRAVQVSVLPAENSSEPAAAAEKGTAVIDWTAPTQNDDGSALTDLVSYKVRYGTSSGTYAHAIDVGNVNQYTVGNLEAGKRYYFAVSAVNSSGQESPVSNEVSKLIE